MRIQKKNFKVYPRLLVYACICFALFVLLVEYMKLETEVSLPVLYGLFLISAAAIYLRKHQKNKNGVFYLFLIATCAVEVIRYFTYNDLDELLSVCFLACIYAIIFNMKIMYQKALFLCSIFALSLTVMRAIKAMFVGSDVFAGNRVGIMVAYFWCSLLVICSKRRALKYGVILFGLTHMVFMQSRTSLLAFCVASIFAIYDDVKGKMSLRKMCLLMFGLIAASVCLYLKLDDITTLFSGKWSTDRSTSSSIDVRMVFWGDIMGHRTLIGLSPDYMVQKYGVENCHNGFVQAYLQFGFIGFVMYILCQLKLTRDAFFSDSPCKYYVIFSLVFSIMESNFWFDSAYPLYPFGLIACWGIICKLDTERVPIYGGGYWSPQENEEGYRNLGCYGIGGYAGVLAA